MVGWRSTIDDDKEDNQENLDTISSMNSTWNATITCQKLLIKKKIFKNVDKQIGTDTITHKQNRQTSHWKHTNRPLTFLTRPQLHQ